MKWSHIICNNKWSESSGFVNQEGKKYIWHFFLHEKTAATTTAISNTTTAMDILIIIYFFEEGDVEGDGNEFISSNLSRKELKIIMSIEITW